MNSKVVFNGKQTSLSFDKIKALVVSYGSFSGSIDAGNTIFFFDSVKPESFQYYIDTFKKQVTTQPETEVTFDIQTDAITTITI
tara:strand:- start:239 stop:490 length:252 start_codon:yes stop_codon:yes gene_type:complete